MLLNESCTAKMLTLLRDSIHSDPESGLLYWVSRVYDDEFDPLCNINTESNSRALASKEGEELNAERVIDMRKRKRLVTLNPTVTWDNGTTSKVKQLSDHKVIRSVRRRLEVPSAPLKIRVFEVKMKCMMKIVLV